MAPEVGLEPTTNRLTADRSTTELLRNNRGAKVNHTLAAESILLEERCGALLRGSFGAGRFFDTLRIRESFAGRVGIFGHASGNEDVAII